MTTQLIEADDRLARVLSHFYVVRQPPDAPAVPQQLLPNYEMLVIFNFGSALPLRLGRDANTIRRVAVIGPLQKLLRYELRAGANIMVVVFTLNGFYRLFGKLLQRNGLGAPDVVPEPAFLTELWGQLAGLPNTDDHIQCFGQYALTHLAPTDDTMQPLLDTIPHFRHTLVDPIKAIAGQHDISVRTLQLRFQHQLGYSAKEMIRFVRFKKVVAHLMNDQPAPPDWADIIFTYGYHDQSHLIRDFQHFTGLPPTAFVKQLAENTLCMSQPGKFY